MSGQTFSILWGTNDVGQFAIQKTLAKLQELGHKLFFTEDPTELLNALGSPDRTFDLVVIEPEHLKKSDDWPEAEGSNQPRVHTGYALAAEIRKNYARLRIMILTSFTPQEETLEQCGLTAIENWGTIVRKPCLSEDLIQAIETG
ncbi:hypothetical protein HN858_01655 [Candidatus Falkowbacteria bacterium]|jgi:hypothetical protein|nr:hypothetical protein [Candidatus Falkowbacteria bacterium]MBT5503762.1 hypothetical protein [Candidatus Falkowbacteria bacterium]MBT6573949.1 hypothetical protein [Candidatus Falkowbacteria bacterium]MBT7348359.1 hypothetical protein [Candidatus Falkowbacteria bacterium]MBT7500256.1 hypothetical protein [Candidatus Falkowbacteria bacterium]